MIGLLVFLGYVCMPIAQSMDSQMIEDRDIKLRVLKEDHSQALWNYLIDQSNKLDRKRAQRLAKALKTKDELQKYHKDHVVLHFYKRHILSLKNK